MSTTVHITPVEQPDALFCHYPGEGRPQDAYLALDLESGKMWCSYDPEIGNAVPASVWHGRTLRWTIPTLTADAANELMEKVTPLAQRILDGAEIAWDGHNRIGRLSADAQQASDEVAKLCDPTNLMWDAGDLVTEMGASDWLQWDSRDEIIARFGLTADTTDERIREMAEQEEREARSMGGNAGYVILSGIAEYLTELRDELKRELGDQ